VTTGEVDILVATVVLVTMTVVVGVGTGRQLHALEMFEQGHCLRPLGASAHASSDGVEVDEDIVVGE
jgi:hypothetical protein